ncbi:MAG TPA: chitobiase/beta-hexosaminidase C-terminal domain-containing protein [Anaeromyxobacter sp.]|nr:chitobiase/beta-hexosaminidase C-terminal domain-containing protein [Anaeromyxobacter sp.]
MTHLLLALILGAQALQPVTFSPAGGKYTSAQTVSASTLTPQATLYCTIDGTTPTRSAKLRFTNRATFTVDSTETIACQAFTTISKGKVYREFYTVSTAGAFYALPASYTTLWQPGVTYTVSAGATKPAGKGTPSTSCTTGCQPPPGWAGGIPNRTTVCATINPSGDTSGATDVSNIQNAINGCSVGGVVQLAAGTFYVPNGRTINLKSYVTLRGHANGQYGDPNATVIRCQSFGGCVPIHFGDWSHNSTKNWYQQVNLAADAVKGAYGVQLSGSTNAQLGEIVTIDEQYDPNLTWYSDRQMNDYLGWGENRTGTRAASRPIGQALEIASINTSAPYSTTSPLVTFTAPFNRTYRVAFAAHMARLTQDGVNVTQGVEWAGLENMNLLNCMAGDAQGCVVMCVSKYSWAKNIETSGGNVLFMHTFRCELRDSFVHTGGSPHPGGGGYLLTIDTYAASNLAENNIMWSANKVMVMRDTGGGNVIGYNYMEDGYGARYGNCRPDWSDLTCSGLAEVGLNASHGTTPHEELFEGNQSYNSDGDSTWGNSIYITFFRNHLTTSRRNIGNGSGMTNGSGYCNGAWSCSGPVARLQDDGNRRGVGTGANHNYYAYVGNVIGYPSTYLQKVAPWPGAPYPARFSPKGGVTNSFEYEQIDFGAVGLDGLVHMWQFETPIPTVIRDGNYDYFTNQVHWHGIGGSGRSNGLTCCGASTTGSGGLANSWYIPASMQPPPFFHGSTWPWIDGTNSTNPIPGTLPARMRFDAGTPDSP